MNIQISEHFTLKKLFKFTLIPIITIILCSTYALVDGLFISNFCGTTAFAAVNMINPYILIFPSFGFMIGSGGNALVSKMLGENKKEEANQVFSSLVLFSVILGIVIAIIAAVFTRPFLVSQGASGEMLELGVIYGVIMLAGIPVFVMQYEFQEFFVAADQSAMAFVFTMMAGITNIALDALFVCVFKWGVVGAGVASVLGQVVGGVGPLLYFLRSKKTTLKLVRARMMPRAILKVCGNGSSEMIMNITTSVVSSLYNFILLKMAGEVGVDAYGVILYITLLFACIFMGYNIAIVPVIGYHYGAQNTDELKGLFHKSLIIIGGYSLLILVVSYAFSGFFVSTFLGYDQAAKELAIHGFRIYALSYIFTRLNFFGSSLFTALNNGLISASLSVVRTLICPVICVFTCSKIWGLDGVWFSLVLSEILSILVTVTVTLFNKKRYNL